MANFNFNKAAMFVTIVGYVLMSVGNLLKAAAEAKPGN